MSNIATSEAQYDPAWWAAQPKAVKALQTMQNQTERIATALQLASKGYVIDVPIAVWSWSPWITTQARKQYGYTWVPSALQPPVLLQPGLTLQGFQPYEPGIIPSGAIPVTLDMDLLPHIFAPMPSSAAAQEVAAEVAGGIKK